jgi:hypothetical protein
MKKEKDGYWNWFHSWTEDEKREAWFYCYHCEEFFKGSEARPCVDRGDTYYECPSSGCGGTPLDWISLEELKETYKIELEIPERGVRYDMNELIKESIT